MLQPLQPNRISNEGRRRVLRAATVYSARGAPVESVLS